MHAFGHDAHTAIGVGVLERLANRDVTGTVKVFFQPAEEIGAGAGSIVDAGHLTDVDTLFAVHVGLGQPTGPIVSGIV